MAISERCCQRIRIILYVAFAISYGIGTVIFIKDFHNYLAAFGFAVACMFIVVLTLLWHVPSTQLNSALSPGSKSRIIFQSAVLSITLAFVASAIYALVQGLRLRQRWAGDSYFCSMVALATAGKWCFFCGTFVRKVGDKSLVEEESDVDENMSLFEPSHGVWEKEKSQSI